jgi:hypothetical protein
MGQRPGSFRGPRVMHRRRSLLPAAGGVPHQAHEGLALPIREIREESNQVSEIGGHPLPKS